MWNLPGPGMEPVSPALAGGFQSAAPPGKSSSLFLYFFTSLLSVYLTKLHEDRNGVCLVHH